MKIQHLDTAEKVVIVAEIGNNHEGNVDLAAEMIKAAAAAGADVVKFQTMRAEHLINRENPQRFKQLKKFELGYEQFEHLQGVALDNDVVFMSTPFDLHSAERLNAFVPAFKIASSDNDFFPLLDKIAGFGKPIVLSAGLTTLDGLKRSVERLQTAWPGDDLADNLAILHCVTSYPTAKAEANLRAIAKIREEFGLAVGYSDHVVGISAAVLSVAFGARIIEKHFTLDKNFSEFRDHQLSADPEDLHELVQRVREAEILLGNGNKELSVGEQKILPLVRRSIVAAQDLPAGQTIAAGDLDWVRPIGGLSPGTEHLLLGKTLKHRVVAGSFVTANDLIDD